MISKHLVDAVMNMEGNVAVDLRVDRLFETAYSKRRVM